MTTKAAHYIDQLDDARCDGNWEAVPELVRKVRKHAQDRTCLTLAAETECAVSKMTAAAARPSSSHTARDLDISERLPALLAAIDEESIHHQDKFQARVCVGWLHWVVADYDLALQRLPKSLEQDVPQGDSPDSVSEWTSVCALKGAYLRANCFMRDGHRAEALEAFRAGMPSLSRVWSGRGVRKQLRYWSELFLTEYCLLSSQALHQGGVELEDASVLSCFRSWAKYWEVMSAPATGGYGFKGAVPRRKIWNQYYLALSRILEHDLPYVSGQVEKIPTDVHPRGQLRIELKQAEVAYQSLLMGETTFPKANEEREEVEAFIKQLMSNWAILCGRGWREYDLGPGGRSGLSRGVLESLYSAATRTFHSTAILRSLFTIHLSLAEFDLGFKAFESYMELVKKGKARVDKTGHPEPSLDDDGMVLEIMSQAVMALCRYGPASSAEKARNLGAELEDWLAKLPQAISGNDTPSTVGTETKANLHAPVPPHTIALAWQAIGLAHAHWSRITHEAGSRTEIQSKAIRCLRRSLAPEYGRSKDIRSFFGLGVLLAERRELTAAIDLVRAALMSGKGQEEDYDLLCGPYWQERSLIQMWHLLALLLSARQDFTMAARACEGALEQFKDSTVLFGKSDTSFRSEHLKDTEAKGPVNESRRGLIEDMDDGEKESILEVKMTQLALVELLEGPDVAVNACSELLTLFSRLFGNIAVQASSLQVPTNTEPPKTAGTFRSIRGSIFGTKTDRSRPPTRQNSTATFNEKTNNIALRPATSHAAAGAAAPAIHVTGENGASPRRRDSSRQRSDSRTRNSLKKRDRSGSRQRPATAAAVPQQPTVVDGESFFTPTVEADQNDFFTRPSQSRQGVRGKPLTSLNSYVSSNSRNSDYGELSVEVIHASPYLLPLIQFSKEKEKTQRTTILVKVWLTVSGLYRRAGLLDDCKGAVAEAQKLVQSLEAESTREPSGSGSVKGSAWAERKSIEHLWGDVWSELGLLSLAKEVPYTARSDFEAALTHWPDHPAATVGLSGILLDIYSEKLLPPPALPPLDKLEPCFDSKDAPLPATRTPLGPKTLPTTPLGLGSLKVASPSTTEEPVPLKINSTQLPSAYNATCLPLSDRLAARDRAFTLLSGLTRLGSGWDYSEAWFALARAHEESGQPDKAKEVLWWCVELEEAMGVREWRCLGSGGYII